MDTVQTIKNQSLDYDKNINDIIKYFNSPIRANIDETASNSYLKSTLDSFQKNYNFILKEQNFSTNIIPFPNTTLFNSENNKYEGNIFSGNAGNALHLFSIKNNYKNNVFVTMEELDRLKLSKFIPVNKIALVNIQSKYDDKAMSINKIVGNKTTARFINIEELLNSKALTEKEFKKYFPDFDKQKNLHTSYTEKQRNNFSNNYSGKDDQGKYSEEKESKFKSSLNQIKIEREQCLLPKYTVELFHYKYCQSVGQKYIPQFSNEEHLKDMITLFKKDPQLLKTAINQAGYIMQKSLNTIFDNDQNTRIVNKENIKDKEKSNERTKENTLNKTHSLSRGR
jgi:hypothetical protein